MIVDEIQKALMAARKAKSGNVVFISTVFAEIQRKAKDKRMDVASDKDSIKTLTDFVNGCEDRKKLIKDEVVRQEIDVEIALYKGFIPEAPAKLSKEKITEIIQSLADGGMDMKTPKGVMGYMKEHYIDMYDGKLVKEVFDYLAAK